MFSKKKKPEAIPTKLEYCEIVATEPKFVFNQYVFRFYARATSPKETYTAKISKDIKGRQPYSDDKSHQLALNELKVLLTADAWQQIGDNGQKWYSLRFKREYKAK